MKIYRTSQYEQTERIAREAAEWLQLMKSAPDAAERSAFASWLLSSPLHAREMLLAGMLDRELSGSGLLDSFDTDAIVARARAEDNVVSLPTRMSPLRASAARHPWTMRRVATIAATFMIGATGWMAVRSYLHTGIQYVTAIGEQRTIRLDDGTRVRLAPGSRILADISTGQRHVTLRQGEAEFEVARDASRPFVVYAGANTIRDIGTRFSVNRLPSGTIVSVTEGSVQVTRNHLAALDNGLGEWAASWLPEELTSIQRPGMPVEALDKGTLVVAGQAAHIARNGSALIRGTVEDDSAAPANASRLVFRDDTLADIAAEFNRYNTAQITIDGDALGQQRYSGVFDATDAASFMQFLECCSGLAVTRRADRWLIQVRATSPVQSR